MLYKRLFIKVCWTWCAKKNLHWNNVLGWIHLSRLTLARKRVSSYCFLHHLRRTSLKRSQNQIPSSSRKVFVLYAPSPRNDISNLSLILYLWRTQVSKIQEESRAFPSITNTKYQYRRRQHESCHLVSHQQQLVFNPSFLPTPFKLYSEASAFSMSNPNPTWTISTSNANGASETASLLDILGVALH